MGEDHIEFGKTNPPMVCDWGTPLYFVEIAGARHEFQKASSRKAEFPSETVALLRESPLATSTLKGE
jgi:hypothetical protein